MDLRLIICRTAQRRSDADRTFRWRRRFPKLSAWENWDEEQARFASHQENPIASKQYEEPGSSDSIFFAPLTSCWFSFLLAKSASCDFHFPQFTRYQIKQVAHFVYSTSIWTLKENISH